MDLRSFETLLVDLRQSLYAAVDVMQAGKETPEKVDAIFEDLFAVAVPMSVDLGQVALDLLRIHPQVIDPAGEIRPQLHDLLHRFIVPDARARGHNRELFLDFKLFEDADRVEESPERHSQQDVQHVLQGARFICESVEDNDLERWFLTQGGQFLRETGAGGGRYYVIDPVEAEQMLTSLGVEDASMEALRASGAFAVVAPAP